MLIQRQLKVTLKSLARLNEILHGKLTPAMDKINDVLDELQDTCDFDEKTTITLSVDKD